MLVSVLRGTVSLWGVHVGVAGIVTVLLVYLLAPGYRYRWHLVAASAVWAVLPDLHHALGWAPALQRAWRTTLHESPLSDVFWLHRVIDRADPRDRPAYSLAMWGALLVVLVATEFSIRRRRRRARGSTAE